DASHDPRSLGNAPARVNATRPVIESRRDASVAGGHAMAQRPVSRRTFLAGAAAAATATAWPRPGAAQSKATITYWNGLTGADGLAGRDVPGQALLAAARRAPAPALSERQGHEGGGARRRRRKAEGAGQP